MQSKEAIKKRDEGAIDGSSALKKNKRNTVGGAHSSCNLQSLQSTEGKGAKKGKDEKGTKHKVIPRFTYSL